MIVIFWTCIFLITFVYIGYPVVLYCIVMFFPYKLQELSETWPSVTILVLAYNEEKVIEQKVRNCLSLDYPNSLLKILIVSDGSNDNTESIVNTFVSRYDNVKLISCPRIGKAQAINESMRLVDTEVVIFSDANTDYDKKTVKELVKWFSDKEIGCVCGRLIYRNPKEVISGEGESFYWRYENRLKILESKIGYLAGANGAIYAIRRSLFEYLPKNTINDDFTISMRIIMKGFKSVFEGNALAYEYVAPTVADEFRRHIRDGAGHYLALIHLLRLLNPFLGVKSFIYWSHRILRWMVPGFLILIFLMNVILATQNFYGIILFMQIIFYAFAILGLLMIKHKKIPFILYVPFYFCNLNLALLLGFIKLTLGRQNSMWERTPRM